jgi:hypothetical protein
MPTLVPTTVADYSHMATMPAIVNKVKVRYEDVLGIGGIAKLLYTSALDGTE